MNTLDYLVPSKARRELLKTLWTDNHKDSVNQLARLAGVAFSTAQRELHNMALSGLAKCEYVGGSTVYEADRSTPLARSVHELLTEYGDHESQLSVPDRNSAKVLAHMKAMGAPLGSTRSKKQKCSDEEMLVSAVALARNNSTLTRTLPVVLSKNVKRLDFEKLAACARKRNARQELGFFLDLTGVLAHDSDLRTKADSLFDRRRKRVTDFFKGKSGKYSARLADQNTPPVAQKWLYRMNMNMDSFQSLFVKHVRTS